METNTDNKVKNNFLECPYCVCYFVSQSDLQSHLDAFGTNKYEHIQKLDEAHKSVDRSYVKRSLSKDPKDRTAKKPKSHYYQY